MGIATQYEGGLKFDGDQMYITTSGGTTLLTLGNTGSANFVGAITTPNLFLGGSSVRLSPGTNGEFGINYNTSATGSLVWYAGGTASKFNVTNAGNATFAGTIAATNFSGSSSGTNTGDQTLPTASSLGAVTLTGTQTISGSKTFSSSSNHYKGHLYYDSYDSAGNHYFHFNDGAAVGGTTVNWRQYYGTQLKTHTWTSDSSGNMTFTFQGDIDANGGDITADNFSGSSSGTNTGDQDLSSYLTSVAFSDLTGKPSTLSGYGINDGASLGLDQVFTGDAEFEGDLLRTNQRISNNQEYPLGHYTPGETVFELNTTWSNRELRQYFGNTNVSWDEVANAPGGYAVYINGSVSVGGVYGSGFPYIPIDQDGIYYMECWIKNAGTAQGHYMGSMDYEADFTHPSSGGGNPGSYGYFVMSNYTSAAEWTKVSGYITGHHNSNTGAFETDATYWTPQALFNYSAGTGTRACWISGWKVIRVDHVGDRTFQDDVKVKGKLEVHTLDNNTSSTTALVMNANEVEKRTLGSLAFSSATIPTNNNQLTNGAGYLTSSSTQSKYLRSDTADTASELITFSKGITSDGNSKFYNWRAVDNTSNSGNTYFRIARVTSSQSSRFMITLAGRSTSYSDNSLPAMGHIVGQLNNDNNYDVVFYNHSTASSEVVTEVGIIDVTNTVVDIYVKVGGFAELTATGHISDGSFAVYSNTGGDGSTASPDGYTVVTEYTAYNSGNLTPLTIGTTSTTAMAGNTSLFDGAYSSLSGTPTLPTLSSLGALSTTGKAADSELLDGLDSSRFVYGDNSTRTAVVTTVNSALPSGFYNGNSITGSPTSTWYTYLNMRHTNTANNYGSQLAVSFYSNADMYVRTINNGTYTGWSKVYNEANLTPLTIGTTATTAMAGNTTIPSGNAVIDWTVDNDNIVIHSGNYTDTDTWVANSATAAGYVASGANQANKVWKTDANGNPGWGTDRDTVYTHPNSAGNKHIPTGGSAGEFLKYSSSGTATWATPSYTTNTDTQLTQSEVVQMLTAGTNVTISAEGVIASTDTDTVYTHPTSAGNKHIPAGGAAGQFLRYSADGTATWATPSYTTNTNTTYSAGTGLDLTSTTFSVEPDLRDGITHVGKDANNYIQFDSTNGRIDFYAGGVFVARMESDGDLHMKGDVIAFSNIFS